jgi:hypothetical protein
VLLSGGVPRSRRHRSRTSSSRFVPVVLPTKFRSDRDRSREPFSRDKSVCFPL